ncbi:MAG: efflux RND transporter periplasmic adaptor subunit [Deferrisomatales bacterium]
MDKSSRRAAVLAAAVAALGLLAAGCGGEAQTAPSAQAPAPPEVGVQVVEAREVTLTTELPGRTSAYLVAEVRPQVGGIIRKRSFTEGADVQAGQVLYEIDPSTYEAAHANAKAALARATANRASARAAHSGARTSLTGAAAALSRAQANAVPLRLKAERFRELVAIDAVSRQDADDALAALQRAEAEIQSAEAAVQGAGAEIEGAEAAIRVAEAEVQAAEAALETTRIQLGHTRVTAPISGRIGRSEVTTGALVTASQPTPLATIQQLDTVYVDVTQSSANLLRLRRSLARGELQSGGPDQARVRLVLEDGTPYPREGVLAFSDVTVDPGTGSVTLRTVFPNPEHLLLPGMYVRAVLEEGVSDRAILVPQRGVTRDTSGRPMVMVVGAEEKAEVRVIAVDRTVGDQWLVTEGLSPGDRVILEGLQRARPGTIVRAVPFGSGPGGIPAAAAQPSPTKT